MDAYSLVGVTVFDLRRIYCVLHNGSTVVESVFAARYVNFVVRYDLHRHRDKI